MRSTAAPPFVKFLRKGSSQTTLWIELRMNGLVNVETFVLFKRIASSKMCPDKYILMNVSKHKNQMG